MEIVVRLKCLDNNCEGEKYLHVFSADTIIIFFNILDLQLARSKDAIEISGLLPRTTESISKMEIKDWEADFFKQPKNQFVFQEVREMMSSYVLNSNSGTNKL